MSDCRCSGTSGQHDTWDYHSDYCPVYMQGKIAALEAEAKVHLENLNEADAKLERQQEINHIYSETLAKLEETARRFARECGEVEAKYDALCELVQEAVDVNRDRLDFCKLRKVAALLEVDEG